MSIKGRRLFRVTHEWGKIQRKGGTVFGGKMKRFDEEGVCPLKRRDIACF